MQETMLLVSLGERFDEARIQDLAGRLADGLEEVKISAFAALEADDTYVYVRGAGALPQIQARLNELAPGAHARVLHLTLDLPGASAGQEAPWHYIVETDVLPEAEADLNAWYDQEHLPGLASVPGTVRAQRWECRDESPRYLACYDLHTQEAFGSPPWLAVRATDWSSRVRPSFRNTRRTMFRKIL
ncbi:MAG: hypothetical protein K0S02_637 [Achromobacter mucicolens]|uniref:DUF4286 family protein n=1 Tax=Achromobacter TaxID=222 RepID=UPI00114F57BD|nr:MULTISPECIES: DUF4286 family protein [Achromobacter]MDF2860365.1 hypothetical protein [Achromobacter mucicolens]TQJ93812.1 hypothetical protein FBY20_0528 [Achromobacter sp. SLBN-14]